MAEPLKSEGGTEGVKPPVTLESLDLKIDRILEAVKETVKACGDIIKEMEKWRKAGRF